MPARELYHETIKTAPQLEQYRKVIERVISEYAALPYSYAPIQAEVIFDRVRDRYVAGVSSPFYA